MEKNPAQQLVQALGAEFERYAGLKTVALDLRAALLASDTPAIVTAAEKMDALAVSLLQQEAERGRLALALCPEQRQAAPGLSALVAAAAPDDAHELQRAGEALGGIAAELQAINEANVVLLRRASALGQRRLRLLQGLPIPAYQADGAPLGAALSAHRWVA